MARASKAPMYTVPQTKPKATKYLIELFCCEDIVTHVEN